MTYTVDVQDHPRVCGKNIKISVTDANGTGSPPRVREKLASGVTKVAKARITPACAGKTCPVISVVWIHRDHPRVCGKNVTKPRLKIFWLGSPPRVREKLKVPHCTSFVLRITPACAGKTYADKGLLNKDWDHPRVCGKN